MGKHIDNTGRCAAVATLAYQYRSIAGQGGRVATDIHNPSRGHPSVCTLRFLDESDQRLHQGKRTFARRVYQPFVCHAIGPQSRAIDFKQITRHKVCRRKRL